MGLNWAAAAAAQREQATIHTQWHRILYTVYSQLHEHFLEMSIFSAIASFVNYFEMFH